MSYGIQFKDSLLVTLKKKKKAVQAHAFERK